MESSQHLARLGAVAALIGTVVLVVSTFLHPLDADSNDARAAFAEYAADPLWVWSHLGQFIGVALLGAALVGLAATFQNGRSAAWAHLGVVGTVATIATAAVLQAVDGVALNVMVDRWAAASGDARDLAFEAAFAVRQIEIGLASLMTLVFGLTVAVFRTAILQGPGYPTWLGAIGLLGALGMVATGAAQATTGFSKLAMLLSMVATFVLLAWFIAASIFRWRLAPRLASPANARTNAASPVVEPRAPHRAPDRV